MSNMYRTVLDSLKNNLSIVTNAGSIFGTMIVTSGLGYVFWWVAARFFQPEDVGLASAAISAMMLLGTIGVLGLGYLLIGELPQRPENGGSLISPALVITGLASLVLGTGFAFLAPYISHDLAVLASSPQIVGLFAAGVVLTGLNNLLDQAVVGLLRAQVQLWRNGIFAALKLGVLVAVSFLIDSRNGFLIYTVWTISNFVSLAYVAFSNLPDGVRQTFFRPQWSLLRDLSGPTFKHYILFLTITVPPSILPIIVTAVLSVKSAGYFYMAWLIASFLFMGPQSLTTVLFAVGASDPSALAEKMRFTLTLSLVLSLGGILVIMVAARPLLGMMGRSYAEEAAIVLRILSLGVLPLIVRAHFVATCQIGGRMLHAARIMAIGGTLELLLAGVGAHLAGLEGLSIGWVQAVCIEAIMTAPLVYRTINPRKTPGQIEVI